MPVVMFVTIKATFSVDLLKQNHNDQNIHWCIFANIKFFIYHPVTDLEKSNKTYQHRQRPNGCCLNDSEDPTNILICVYILETAEVQQLVVQLEELVADKVRAPYIVWKIFKESRQNACENVCDFERVFDCGSL